MDKYEETQINESDSKGQRQGLFFFFFFYLKLMVCMYKVNRVLSVRQQICQ